MEKSELLIKIAEKKEQIEKNIIMAKESGHNRVTVIMLIDENSDSIRSELVNWLIVSGYKISLKTDEFHILTIEW